MERAVPLVAIVLAAGKSTRMEMQPKAVLPLAGRPMGQRVLEAVRSVEPLQTLVVVGHQAERVRAVFGPDCAFVLQQPQLGTAHALLSCEKSLPAFSGDLLVLSADHPLVSPDDLRRLISHHRRTGAEATLLTWQRSGDSSYGRILRDESGKVNGIIEVRDASPEQLAIREVNLSIYCFAAPFIFDILRRIRPDNVQREYYLTDAVGLLTRSGKRVEAVEAQDAGTGLGINTPEELAEAEAFLLERQALR